MTKRILTFIAGMTAALNMAAEDLPAIANIYARPHQSLNGKWSYIVDPLENGYYDYRLKPMEKTGFFENRKQTSPDQLVEYNFDTSPQMEIPSDWNSKDEQLFMYEGTVWFKRDFRLDRTPGKRYILYFGAVNYEAKVWVNGKKAGEHTGGYTPFNFDITDLVSDGDNFVVVKADDKRAKDNVPTVNMDWWNYGGITRDVLIAELDDTYIADYSISLDGNSTSRISGWIQLNNEIAGKDIILEIPELGISEKCITDSSGQAAFSVRAKPALWSPDNPKLYDIVLRYEDSDIRDMIGFRTISTSGKQILLNGEPVFLKGISIHEEAPFRSGRAWSPEDAATLLGWAKELGCNYVRLAHYPHNEHMVRTAEKLGLMVWSEIPVYWTISWNNPGTYANAENQLTEMIRRDRNRCSVIIWSIANETPHGEARDRFLSSLSLKARELDPSRLISMAMEVTRADNGVNTLDDNMNEYVDIISFNQYVGWYRNTLEEARTMKWVIPYDKPVIISEFGGGAQAGLHGEVNARFTEEYQEELYIRNLEMLDKIDGLAGLSPWILMDFRSPRRQLPYIQDFYNRKGLISDWGLRKKAFFIVQEYYGEKRPETPDDAGK